MRLALILSALALAASCGRADPAPEEWKRHPASHVIRITAELTFDGAPVEIDELVDCRAYYRGALYKTPHLTFSPSRVQVANETADGGMIVFRVSRSFCWAFAKTWGGFDEETNPPPGWTPALEWYDNRDPALAQMGLLYLSETALTAPNGRLRIVEPFQLSIPEHPPSEALIAEAERQDVERDMWFGRDVTGSYRYLSSPFAYKMEALLKIPESEWRNPERAKASWHWIQRRNGRHDPEPDWQALARYLDGVTSDARYVDLGYIDRETYPDAVQVLERLRAGRGSDLNGIYESGIPKPSAPRYGLLISEKRAGQWATDPFNPNYVDEFIPVTCIDGVMTADPAHPGLRYWFRERCSHHKLFIGFDFFGVRLTIDVTSRLSNLIFDTQTGDLWRVGR